MPDYSNKRIVVIDDEELWTKRIVRILSEQNFRYIDVKYPLPAFSELVNRYDLAIIDIRMKRFDGFQIKNFFKTKSPSTKVILISQFDDFGIDILGNTQGLTVGFTKKT